MSERPFVHLHCHTHYSLLDGASRIPELVKHAKSLGMNAIALTDHGNLYGAIEFYRECKAADVNPVIGYEAYIATGKRTEREGRKRGEAAWHLTLLAQNETGFKNLIKMASIAFLEGYYYVPRIDKELLEAHSEGIVCLSGCASGEFSELILKEQMDEATELARYYHQLFGDNFYVEIQNNGLDIQRLCCEGAVDIANKLGLPLVATSDAHYLTQADNNAHDVLLCINTGRLRSDENRMRYGSDQFYVRGPEEMYKLFPGKEEAVKRSQEIADKVDIQLDFKKRHFPVFTPPAKKTAEQYLRELCVAGMKERYGSKPAKEVTDRLEHELDIICRMGFASYFLITWDFVRFALEKGIPCSARGSACGALVSYALKLSHVCPLEFDLLFERFLDPNRSEAPDIDIDFCQQRREEVIAYVREKYGEESVAQIGTFGTMAARAALRDVGRVLDIPLARVDQIAKMVPQVLNITLEDALKQNPDLEKEYSKDKQIRELIDIARKLEGTNRNAGTHAAGVVIADGALTNFVPLQRVMRKSDGEKAAGEVAVTTQWTMGDLEKVGMLKMDFLGLRTLTLVENALKLIKKTRNEDIDIQAIPFDDADTYALLQRGDAKGVFQFESDGIRELLKRMKPDNIRDLIATNALYRPGPLGGGMVDAYVNRKHGREPFPEMHDIMRDILQETHGVMVYQEQVMRILNRLGGIELSSAYVCIKAISKKKHDIIDQRREEFIKGAQERGVEAATAREVFELIEFFGGYGFNKSHSAAYARVGYQTAWLKAHYTAEFMAALLTSEIEDSNKRDIMVQHIDDARRLGVDVLAPDINAGEADFTVENGKILFGLTAIKGVGRGAAQEIVRARQEGGSFKDMFELCERVDLKAVTSSAIEKLIKAGAFDKLHGNRAALMEALPRALQAAGAVQEDRKHGQRNFFEMLEGEEDSGPEPANLPDIPDWQSSERLKYEKEALDFYFSSHPLAQHETDLNRFSSASLDRLRDLAANQEVVIGGMLTQVRYQNTKRARNGNSRYMRCTLVDLTGSAECVMWPDDFVQYKDDAVEDAILFVRASVEKTREEPGLVISKLMSIDKARLELTSGLVLTLKQATHEPMIVDRLVDLLQRSPGGCPVYLRILDGAGKRSVLKTSQFFSVNPGEVPMEELEMVLGAGHVQFTGHSGGRNGNGR